MGDLNKNKTVGGEMVDRLRRFTETLESAESTSDLPELLTVRKVKLNLSPRAFSAAEVKEIRRRLSVSQAIFAEFIGVAAATLRDWEQGVSTPSGPACRIMDEIALNFDAWSKRIRDLAAVTAS